MLNKYKEILNDKGEVYLRVKAHPGCPLSKVTEVLADETIKIDIAARPEKGKANEELFRFIAGEFGVSADSVKIISGAASRLKLLKIKI